ncbi:MAG TPA: response regulator transcription factor [Saprospiraceae bacterium]|nr:response regulator transcription factor [Saprospiraceae bacterium]
MNVLIIEDEKHTANRLAQLLKQLDRNIKIIGFLDSVQAAVQWFKEDEENPDLIFQDIILNDGNCFEIFDQIEVTTPIIFTTAYSEYAIRSFKLNSIDYVVKPYDITEIERALNKFHQFKEALLLPEKNLLKQVLSTTPLTTRNRFLVKKGETYLSIDSRDVAYLESEESITFATLFNGTKHIIDYTISDLSQQLDPVHFFQINRKIILQIKSVKKINTWFNNRLILQVTPPLNKDVIVSRDRVKKFKEWLGK